MLDHLSKSSRPHRSPRDWWCSAMPIASHGGRASGTGMWNRARVTPSWDIGSGGTSASRAPGWRRSTPPNRCCASATTLSDRMSRLHRLSPGQHRPGTGRPVQVRNPFVLKVSKPQPQSFACDLALGYCPIMNAWMPSPLGDHSTYVPRTRSATSGTTSPARSTQLSKSRPTTPHSGSMASPRPAQSSDQAQARTASWYVVSCPRSSSLPC